LSKLRKKSTAFALLVLLSCWVPILGSSLLFVTAGVCQHFGMKLDAGDWLQAMASLTAVGAAIFVAGWQLRRDSMVEQEKGKVVLVGLVRMTKLAKEEVSLLYKNTGPSKPSQHHQELVLSMYNSFMDVDVLTLPDHRMIDYVLQVRGMLLYSLSQYERMVTHLTNYDDRVKAHETIRAAEVIINGAWLNLRRLSDSI
jgi:hypothetical protein